LQSAEFSDNGLIMDITKRFRRRVEKFLLRTGMTPSAFGSEALNDSNFVFNLREGRGPGLRTVQKVYDYMAERKG
jgi:hypothetical protein